MKVVMIGAGNPPSTFIARQIQALERNRIDVALLPEFRTHKFMNARLCRSGFVFHLPRQMRDLISGADIVHYQWPGHLWVYCCLARRFHKRIILSLRGRQINILPHVPGHEKYLGALRALLPLCDAYHCVSQNILSEARHYGLEPRRAWIIRPAVDTSFFVPPSVMPVDYPVRIAMVGALMWRKGYEYALLAIRQLVERGVAVRLTIVGDGEERDRVTYTIDDLGLGSQVTLAGRLPPDGVRTILQESHIFLHTSLSEGIANGALEAMACGLPVVTADADGMREAVTDGREGFLVPLRDVDATAERLGELARNASLRGAMGERARRRAVAEFDLQDQGRKFLQMYQAVIAHDASCDAGPAHVASGN